MYKWFTSIAFRIEPERAHHLTLKALNALHRLHLDKLLFARPPSKPRKVMGVTFPNPVGLAAGMDKDGRYIDAFGALGFGFIEVGTVTPRPQPGNPKPRLFRVPEAQALINRMGFNNEGVGALTRRIRRRSYRGILGVNIGKNADTPNEKAIDDYILCLKKVYAHTDYVAVNISSPNTPGLRTLQESGPMENLFASLKAEQGRLARAHDSYTPLVIKIAPDLSDAEIERIAKAIGEYEIDGVIATNTTLAYATEAGGLSGAPLRAPSNHVIRILRAALSGRAPIIGAGGVFSPLDAREKFAAGADLVQVYTGLVYKGPRLVDRIIQACSTDIT